jgi:hypothetical protein
MHIETEETPEGTTVLIHGTIQDHGTPPVSLAASDLTTLTVTIYEKGSRSLVGDWNDKDVLGVNGGTFDGTTNEFTLRLAPEDTEPLFPARKREEWIIMFRWSYNAGQDVGHQEASFPLANRPHVPATS